MNRSGVGSVAASVGETREEQGDLGARAERQ
jgi:hypothetical protein